MAMLRPMRDESRVDKFLAETAELEAIAARNRFVRGPIPESRSPERRMIPMPSGPAPRPKSKRHPRGMPNAPGIVAADCTFPHNPQLSTEKMREDQFRRWRAAGGKFRFEKE